MTRTIKPSIDNLTGKNSSYGNKITIRGVVRGVKKESFPGVCQRSGRRRSVAGAGHLPPNLLTGEFGIGQHIPRPGFGYGFNCAVVFDPAEAGLPDGKGTALDAFH
ncbi:MAG TPA: hypothetical protein VKB61_08925 [Candidatus Acidoferrum sp.]|nr:hypothetical protein [Candidatus Acidoferrum sp.]